MFRRYCRSGFVLIGIGVGMLLSCLLRIGPICIACGIGLTVLGMLISGKSQ